MYGQVFRNWNFFCHVEHLTELKIDHFLLFNVRYDGESCVTQSSFNDGKNICNVRQSLSPQPKLPSYNEIEGKTKVITSIIQELRDLAKKNQHKR